MEFGSGTGDIDTFWAIPGDTVSIDPDASQSANSLFIQDQNGRKLYHENQDLDALSHQWTDLPFELSLPSPEYDASVNQASTSRHSRMGLTEYSDDSMDASRGSADSTDTSYEDGSLLIEDFLDSPFQEQSMSESLHLLMLEQEEVENGGEDISSESHGRQSQSNATDHVGHRNLVRSQLGTQLGSPLGSQLLNQMSAQMNSQINAQVNTEMNNLMESSMHTSIPSHSGNQHPNGSHMGSQMGSQMRTQLGTQLGGQLNVRQPDQINGTYGTGSHDPNPQYVRTHPIPPQQRQNWRGFARRQSISKMPLAQLYQIMGLPHNHSSARDREERIMSELQKSGFQIGQQTWIRDTEESFRRNVIDRIYQQTKDEYGYSKHLLEAIIRRGTYARMQSNLRRRRRHMSRMKRRGPAYD